MKHIGSHFEYENERNHDLFNTYRRLLRDCRHIHMPTLFTTLVQQPASRFWVSEERAAIVIADMMRGRPISHMRLSRQEMYHEIYKRVLLLRRTNPCATIYELVFNVVHQPAPQFYLTPGSAKVIIHKIKTKWYEKRRLKHSHSF